MLMPILFALAVLAVLALGYTALSGPSPAKSVKRRLELLREREMTDVMVIVGGTIPDEDAAELKEQGVAAVHGAPGPLVAGVDFEVLRCAVGDRVHVEGDIIGKYVRRLVAPYALQQG